MIPSTSQYKKGSVSARPPALRCRTTPLILCSIVALVLAPSCAHRGDHPTHPEISEEMFRENLPLAEAGSLASIDIVISYYKQEQEHLDLERWEYKKSTLKSSPLILEP